MVLSTAPWEFSAAFLGVRGLVCAYQCGDMSPHSRYGMPDYPRTLQRRGKSKVMILFFQSDQRQKTKYLLQLGFRVPVRDVAVVSFQAHLVASPDQMVG